MRKVVPQRRTDESLPPSPSTCGGGGAAHFSFTIAREEGDS